MHASPRLMNLLSKVVILWGIGSQSVTLGQEVRLTLPADDPVENSEPVSSIAFSPDGKLIATTHGTNLGMLQKPTPGQTILWDAPSGKRVKAISALQDGVRLAAFSPDGKTLLVLEGPGIIRWIAIPEGREIRKFQLDDQDRGYYSVAFFPDGKQLVAGIAANIGSPKSEVQILDLTSGKLVRTLVGHRATVDSVAVSPDGKLVASGAMDGTARIWDARTGLTLAILKFPPSEKVLEAIAKEKPTPEEIEMEQYLHWMQSVAFSPDGRTIAAACTAGFEDPAEVGVWEISTAKWKATLKTIDPRIQQAVFSPDGKTLVTAGSNGTTTLWDTATSKNIGTITGCYPIAFSPDGKTIAATVSTRSIVIQKTPNADPR